jgi:hypothetical protein
MQQSLGLVALVVRDYDEALGFLSGNFSFSHSFRSLVNSQRDLHG